MKVYTFDDESYIPDSTNKTLYFEGKSLDSIVFRIRAEVSDTYKSSHVRKISDGYYILTYRDLDYCQKDLAIIKEDYIDSLGYRSFIAEFEKIYNKNIEGISRI